MQRTSSLVKTLFVVGVICACALSGSIRAHAQSLISATYGSGDNRVDVTSRLQSLAHGGNLSVRVDNQNMGVDPAPRQPKDLRIQQRDNDGQVHEYMFREGQIASLQVDSRAADYRRGYADDDDRRDRDWDRHDRDLVIVRAFYGINNATAEVTGHLQDLVRDNSLVIRVDNQTLGVDPAHEHGKVLCVFYRYRGEAHAAIVRETERLAIP
ncbi:MAG TPA: DUF3395 domain-containing protein [Terriglobales bacterium]